LNTQKNKAEQDFKDVKNGKKELGTLIDQIKPGVFLQ
jgi:hypothetical protein